MRIELPTVTADPNKRLAHPYPFQIGFLTQEILQGTIFKLTLLDTAAGLYVRQPDAIRSLESKLAEEGLDREGTAQGWTLVGIKHKELHELLLPMNLLVALKSQWDWYIRNLSRFTRFALTKAAP